MWDQLDSTSCVNNFPGEVEKVEWIHRKRQPRTTLEKSSGQSAGGVRRLFLFRSGTPTETCVRNPGGTDLRSSIP